METQIKKAIKAGNSSAVILPRAWLNMDVKVELAKKTPESILIDSINIIKNYIELNSIIGIYLTGSYARKEEDEKSDIDILVITKDIDKEIISDGIYNILIISEELLNQKLNSDLFLVGAMIKEAIPLLNSSYLDKIEVKVTKKNIKWYLDTTEEKLNIVKKILNKNTKKYITDKISYTLVLRIRTLYIIKAIITNKFYSKNEFIKLIQNITGNSNAYKSYLSVKNDLKEKNKTDKEEALKLYNYLNKQLNEVREMVR